MRNFGARIQMPVNALIVAELFREDENPQLSRPFGQDRRGPSIKGQDTSPRHKSREGHSPTTQDIVEWTTAPVT